MGVHEGVMMGGRFGVIGRNMILRESRQTEDINNREGKEGRNEREGVGKGYGAVCQGPYQVLEGVVL